MQRALIIIAAIAALTLLSSAVYSKIGSDSDGTRCAYRLRRLAVATQAWIVDHGRRELPQWQDDGGTYDPTHPKSIEYVLWPYLRGDVMSKQARSIEELRRTSMAVCPATQKTYKINSDFSGHQTLWALIEHGGTWLAQDRDPNSHRQNFQPGGYAVDIHGVTNPSGPGGRLDPGVPYWIER